jgi:hypothetical protein
MSLKRIWKSECLKVEDLEYVEEMERRCKMSHKYNDRWAWRGK